MIAHANSPTHCQVAPANAQTQAWQRVCLLQRSTETTDKPTDEKEARTLQVFYFKFFLLFSFFCFLLECFIFVS